MRVRVSHITKCIRSKQLAKEYYCYFSMYTCVHIKQDREEQKHHFKFSEILRKVKRVDYTLDFHFTLYSNSKPSTYFNHSTYWLLVCAYVIPSKHYLRRFYFFFFIYLLMPSLSSLSRITVIISIQKIVIVFFCF